MARRKQDWSPREEASARGRAIALWPRLQKLARNHDGESRNRIRDVLDKPVRGKTNLMNQLDDVLWLIEGDHHYEGLSYQIDPLWRLTREALRDLQGE